MNDLILIFDFDGTIADTHRYIVEISNRLSDEFNFEKIDLTELEDLKDKSSKEIIKYLNVPVMKIPAILVRAKKEFHKGIEDIKPFYGLDKILYDLKKIGAKMGILSSNSHENVTKFLKNHDINVFDFIHTTSMVWTKNTSLKKLIHKNGFDMNKVLYIGDEIRDIAAAKRLGIKIAAVTWGYNSMAALKKHSPDYILQKPEEIKELFVSESSL